MRMHIAYSQLLTSECMPVDPRMAMACLCNVKVSIDFGWQLFLEAVCSCIYELTDCLPVQSWHEKGSQPQGCDLGLTARAVAY